MIVPNGTQIEQFGTTKSQYIKVPVYNPIFVG